MFLIQRLKQHLPKTHLMAAGICTLIIGTTALLLPSSKVPASDSAQVQIPLSLNEAGIAEQNSDSLAVSDIDKLPATAAGPQVISSIATAPIAAIELQTAEAPKIVEHWQDVKVKSGDTLTSIFKRAGLTPRDVYNVTAAVKGSEALARLYPGQTISFVINEGKLHKLKHIRNQLESSVVSATESGYQVEDIAKQPKIKTRFAEGSIENSLFYDASQAGLSDKMIMELAAIFGWDIDFVLDLRQGDSFNLVFEEKYLDGELIGEGNIISAQFVNRGETYTAIRYTDSKGNTSYFNPQGESMRKAFLRSPVDFARISSSFKNRRKHPVLGLTRAHRGTDYAAGTGTPIKAAGEGKIIWRGTKGGYGKCVIVQHGGNITTLYAHMNNYRKGQRTGTRVKQGQVIGYVGKTGLASGPHLHYEFRVNGVHKNPQTVKLPHAAPIDKAERNAFFATAKNALSQLESYKATQLASAAN